MASGFEIAIGIIMAYFIIKFIGWIFGVSRTDRLLLIIAEQLEQINKTLRKR